jgi:restriction endonuclease S subunit
LASKQFFQATIQNVSAERYANLVVPVPPIIEQRTIVDWINVQTYFIDRLIAKIRDGIARLKEFRTALISAAVTGKIDVREEVA